MLYTTNKYNVVNQLHYTFFFLNLKHCISFAKHQNESATGFSKEVY